MPHSLGTPVIEYEDADYSTDTGQHPKAGSCEYDDDDPLR
jgi:hypothetical protein